MELHNTPDLMTLRVQYASTILQEQSQPLTDICYLVNVYAKEKVSYAKLWNLRQKCGKIQHSTLVAICKACGVQNWEDDFNNYVLDNLKLAPKTE